MKKKIGIVIIVLLVLAIIGIVGMIIVNSSNNDVINMSLRQMSQQEKDIFNKKFMIYEGVQSGATVKDLIDKVIENNQLDVNLSNDWPGSKIIDLYIEDDNITEKEVIFGNENIEKAVKDFTENAIDISSKINTNKSYRVYTYKNRYIDLISDIAIIDYKSDSIDSVIQKIQAREKTKVYEHADQISEYEKQLEREKILKKNIIALSIIVVILVGVIIITFKKRKKKVEEKE